MKKNDICILDIEASGLSCKSYPIEIAWKTEDGTSDSFLITPHERWTHWSEEAEKGFHHIPRETLFTDGISLQDACIRLNQALRGKTVYSDNAQFDNLWLDDLFHFAGNGLRPLFTLRQVNAIYYHMGSRDKVREFNSLLSTHSPKHRALSDCDRFIQTLNQLWPQGLRNKSERPS